VRDHEGSQPPVLHEAVLLQRLRLDANARSQSSFANGGDSNDGIRTLGTHYADELPIHGQQFRASPAPAQYQRLFVDEHRRGHDWLSMDGAERGRT